MILDDLFYVPPDFSGIKTYYSESMLQELHLDD